MERKKKKERTSRLMMASAMLALSFFSFYLCRHVFFKFHGMKSWPELLAGIAAIASISGALSGRWFLSVAGPLGYLGGFLAAMLFNSNGLDPGGGTTNNGWIIWTAVFLTAMAVGALMDVVRGRNRRT